MDVLAPGIGEIIGGSQREERLDVLDRRMAQFGLDPAHYWWYRDLRRYGTVPHAGFGLGFERLMVYVCGMANIRDVIPYPRAAGTPSSDILPVMSYRLSRLATLWPPAVLLAGCHTAKVLMPPNLRPPAEDTGDALKLAQ